MKKRGTNYSIASDFFRNLKDSERSMEQLTSELNLEADDIISEEESYLSSTEELVPRKKNLRRITTPFEGLGSLE